jgi:hypothetical protein
MCNIQAQNNVSNIVEAAFVTVLLSESGVVDS